MELLQFAFMQRALAAGILIGLACAVLGIFLVLRRDAMIGHGLAHVTVGGVALGLLLGVTPLWAALAVAVVGALGILRLKDRAGLHGDTAIGIVSSTGFALGIVIASWSGKFSVELFGYLFGNILAIGPVEVWISAALAALVISLVVLNYNDLSYTAFDHQLARVSGIHVDRLNYLLAVLTAVTVVLAMKVVGIVLVAALLVIPAATGLQLGRTFRWAMLLSALTGVLSVTGGLVSAYYLDLPAAGSIVILAASLFLLSVLVGSRFRGP